MCVCVCVRGGGGGGGGGTFSKLKATSNSGLKHFKSLLDPSTPPNMDWQHSTYINASLPILETVAIENDVINVPICSGELLESSASLKRVNPCTL